MLNCLDLCRCPVEASTWNENAWAFAIIMNNVEYVLLNISLCYENNVLGEQNRDQLFFCGSYTSVKFSAICPWYLISYIWNVGTPWVSVPHRLRTKQSTSPNWLKLVSKGDRSKRCFHGLYRMLFITTYDKYSFWKRRTGNVGLALLKIPASMTGMCQQDLLPYAIQTPYHVRWLKLKR